MEYRPVRVSDVIRGINKDYYLPAIQRELVWQVGEIEKLFDSVMSDFPIGSFLFWKVNEENKDDWVVYDFIRDFDKENPHNKEANLKGINKDIYLVLDGQQRINSLYIGLKGSFRYFHYKWRKTRLYLNLLKKPVANDENPEELVYEFRFREDDILDNSEQELWYEVGKILDFEDAEDAKSDMKDVLCNIPEEQKDNANKLIGKLHSKIHTVCVINYYEEKSQDYDKVLNIFVRANASGQPLEYSDLLLSTATAKWEELDARKEINKFTDDINEIGNGYKFGKDFVLKGSLYLTEELPVQYKVRNFNKKNLIKIEKNWEHIKTYISLTVRLVAKYGFASKNIVAPLALLPISFFLIKKGKNSFDESSEISDVNIQITIRRWLILATLKNAFGSASDTKLKNIRDIMLGLPDFNNFPITQINKELGIENTLSESEIEGILGYKYQGKYTFLALSLLYPDREWKDAVFHEDHIFPKSEFQRRKLKKRGYSSDKIDQYINHFNTLVNLQLLTDSENFSKSATPFDEWIATRDENFKKRHSIPNLDSYSFDKFEEFIKARKVKIIDVFSKI